MKLKYLTDPEDKRNFSRFLTIYPQQHDIKLCEEAFADALDQDTPFAILNGARYYDHFCFINYKGGYPSVHYIMKAQKWLETRQYLVDWKEKAFALMNYEMPKMGFIREPHECPEQHKLGEMARKQVEQQIADLDAKAGEAEGLSLREIMKKAGKSFSM